MQYKNITEYLHRAKLDYFVHNTPGILFTYVKILELAADMLLMLDHNLKLLREFIDMKGKLMSGQWQKPLRGSKTL